MSWYLMHRGWMNSPVFAKEPFTEREAWEWLIGNACWKETTISVSGQPVKLEAGQLSYSQRYLENAWSWKPGRAKRFIDKLAKWGMVDATSHRKSEKNHSSSAAATAAGQQVITISNYNKYQVNQNENAAAAQQQPQQERSRSAANKKEDITSLTNNNNISADFAEFWSAAVKRIGKDAARRKYDIARRKATKDEIHNAWRQFNLGWAQKKGTPDFQFVPHPATWLHQGRWADEAETPVPKYRPLGVGG